MSSTEIKSKWYGTGYPITPGWECALCGQGWVDRHDCPGGKPRATDGAQ